MKEALAERRFTDAAKEAGHLSPGRVAEILASAPRGTVVPTLREFRPEEAGEVLAHMPPPLAADILSSLDLEEARAFFRRIRPEYAADIYHVWLGTDPKWAEAVLEGIDEPARSLVRDLGRFPPETAGRRWWCASSSWRSPIKWWTGSWSRSLWSSTPTTMRYRPLDSCEPGAEAVTGRG